MWEVYIEPNLKAQAELEQIAGRGQADSGPEVGREGWAKPKAKVGSFDPSRATKAEMDAFLDKLCGGRKYTGPRWWLGEGGTKIHSGK